MRGEPTNIDVEKLGNVDISEIVGRANTKQEIYIGRPTTPGIKKRVMDAAK